MAKREFLMLAHTYKRAKYGIGGYYMSEKLDGMRCLWDGGISRGLPKSSVPWANNKKDERYHTPPVATGLWSRYGNVIHAPDWWLDNQPKMLLDGELYFNAEINDLGFFKHGGFKRQDLLSIIKQLDPDDRWKQVVNYVFDSPPPDSVFANGSINVTNFEKEICGISDFMNGKELDKVFSPQTAFRSVEYWLRENILTDYVFPLPQFQLPYSTTLAERQLEATLSMVIANGGEGVMLRKPESWWQPHRSHDLLKVKPHDDAEGTVVGYVTGRRTEKGSKLLGLMGAIVLELDNGKRMELSGFTDEERELYDKKTDLCGEAGNAHHWACENPETKCPDWIEATQFPRGTKVTFKYRGKSSDGIPQEARYWRKQNDL